MRQLFGASQLQNINKAIHSMPGRFAVIYSKLWKHGGNASFVLFCWTPIVAPHDSATPNTYSPCYIHNLWNLCTAPLQQRFHDSHLVMEITSRALRFLFANSTQPLLFVGQRVWRRLFIPFFYWTQNQKTPVVHVKPCKRLLLLLKPQQLQWAFLYGRKIHTEFVLIADM